MKKNIYATCTWLLLLAGTAVFAQTVPQKFNYQAVVRNANGSLITPPQQVSVRFTIQDSAAASLYSELHTSVNVNQFGLISLRVGDGTPNAGNSFSSLNWQSGKKFLNVKFDANSSSNPTTDMGTTELVSVPFALYAATAPNNLTAGAGIDIVNNVVTNTAPNQPVTITAGPGVTISGTYPNFTVTANDQSETNELQTLSYDSTTRNLALSNNGGTVKLPNHSPVGSIIAFGGLTAPEGWLLCDGAEYNNSQYPALAAAIGTNFGSSAPATRFRVPDLRGRFLRGVSGTSTNDPDRTTRTVPTGSVLSSNNVGSTQPDAFQGHWHELKTNTANNSMSANSNSPLWGWNGAVQTATTGYGAVSPISDGVNGTPRTSSETRPKNVYVNYIIKH